MSDQKMIAPPRLARVQFLSQHRCPRGWPRPAQLDMTQTMPQMIDSGDCRLLSYLQHLTLLPGGQSGANLAEQLASLIDLSESISLAQSLGAVSRVQVDAGGVPSKPERLLLAARGAIMRDIVESFDPGAARASFVVPVLSADALADMDAAYAPFQRFYQLHQSEMEQRVAALRKSLRQGLSDYSTPLAQLAALDRVVAEPLQDHSRRLLAVVPRLLGRRFAALAQSGLTDHGSEPRDWLRPGGWLAQFQTELRQLLLAELDFRLLPALGLVEAHSAAGCKGESARVNNR